jgi:predicted DNA-binding protein
MSKKYKKFTINIDDEFDRRLEAVASRLGLTKSGFVRMVVTKAIEEEERKRGIKKEEE